MPSIKAIINRANFLFGNKCRTGLGVNIEKENMANSSYCLFHSVFFIGGA
jgi:hypothetical protein